MLKTILKMLPFFKCFLFKHPNQMLILHFCFLIFYNLVYVITLYYYSLSIWNKKPIDKYNMLNKIIAF